MFDNLTNDFFTQPTLDVAKGLLGMRLSTFIRGKETSGMIVEVEAYHGETDEAAHSFGRVTKRNQIMFEEGGLCYVYFIYGMYHCVNVVTEKKGVGAAVLIRAIEPLTGAEIMRRRRGLTMADASRKITSGPGKVCAALSIDKRMLGEHYLSSPRISISPYRALPKNQIIDAVRIGISKSKDLKWRFYMKDNLWVSR